jgi:hypothetical protein
MISRLSGKLVPISWGLLHLLCFVASVGSLLAQNLNDLPTVLSVPVVEKTVASPGKRVAISAPGWDGKAAYHTLYLPTDWKAGGSYPVLVEYPGNGPFTNKFGDVSDGTVEGCVMGYGLSGGKGFVWLSLPFVNAAGENQIKWWGDVAATKRYCHAAVDQACTTWGGDPKRVVLMGFSRGAIACNYIGLHDDKISQLWAAFICHSHYDGVREGWGYPEADRASALVRLKRLGIRPQWISHEQSVDPTQAYLERTGVTGLWTFRSLPHPNHSARWLMQDHPLRGELRYWLAKVLSDTAR